MTRQNQNVKGVKGNVNPDVKGETRMDTGVLRVLRANPPACTRTPRRAHHPRVNNKTKIPAYTRTLHTLHTLHNQVVVRVSDVKGDFVCPSHPSHQVAMTNKTGNLRQAMPSTTAFIDDMRDAFGAEMINSAIRAGIDGAGTFWARENGHEIGSRLPIAPDRIVSMAETHVGPLRLTKERK